jgi:hypothetical protein
MHVLCQRLLLNKVLILNGKKSDAFLKNTILRELGENTPNFHAEKPAWRLDVGIQNLASSKVPGTCAVLFRERLIKSSRESGDRANWLNFLDSAFRVNDLATLDPRPRILAA